jgi:hypothetical protein
MKTPGNSFIYKPERGVIEMADNRNENVHRKEEPDRTGSTFIKYFFIAVITIAILWFLASYILPMFTGDGGGGDVNNGTDNNDSNLEIDIDGDLNMDGNEGNGDDGNG